MRTLLGCSIRSGNDTRVDIAFSRQLSAFSLVTPSRISRDEAPHRRLPVPGGREFPRVPRGTCCCLISKPSLHRGGHAERRPCPPPPGRFSALRPESR